VQGWMGQVGARAESPVTLLGEYLQALRGLLRGERLTVDGRYVRLDDVALDWPPLTPPAVLAAAAGPRTIQLSAEFADGTILDSSGTADRVRRACLAIDEARAAAGRPGAHPVVLYLLAVTGPGAARRLEAMGQAGTIAVAGDAHAVADAVRFWAAAGADKVVLHPAPTTRTRWPSSGSRPSGFSRCWRDGLTRGTRRPHTSRSRRPAGRARPARRARR